MTPVEVREVGDRTGSADREAFEALPAEVYADDERWAPASASVALDCFRDANAGVILMSPVLATRGGRVVARAAGIIDTAAGGAHGDQQGCVGLLECLPGEVEAGVAVVSHCRTWLSRHGSTTIVAPRVNGLVSGLLAEGFDRPQTFLTPYNPPWYASILTAAGFAATASSVAFEFTRDRVPQFGDTTTGRVTVRHVDAGAFLDEIDRIHRLQEVVFARHPGHQTRALAQTRDLATRLLPAIDPDLILIAEDPFGAVIGILLCVPDAWQRRSPGAQPTRARLISLGVADPWRRHGVATALGSALAEALLAKGYTRLEASMVMDDNAPPLRLASELGASLTRRFEMFEFAEYQRSAMAVPT